MFAFPRRWNCIGGRVSALRGMFILYGISPDKADLGNPLEIASQGGGSGRDGTVKLPSYPTRSGPVQKHPKVIRTVIMTVTHVYGRDHLQVCPGRPMLNYRQTARTGGGHTDGDPRSWSSTVRIRSSDALNPPDSPTITSIVIGMGGIWPGRTRQDQAGYGEYDRSAVGEAVVLRD